MDTPRHPLSNSVSSSSSVQSNCHTVFHNSPRRRRHLHPLRQHHSPIQNGLHTPIIGKTQQLDRSPWYMSSTSKYSSPRLRPLITKFEALDADSLTFNIRDAQLPHLRLPGSRMGRHGQEADIKKTKTTREKLLILFDRPGWGARTLRGFRDGGVSGELEKAKLGEEGIPSRTQGYEVLGQSTSPQRGNDIEGWLPNARPRLKRESRIMDKVRFFDGGMDFQPPGYSGPWRLNTADCAVPSQFPSRFQPRGSPSKPGLYSVSPSSHHAGKVTPIKSYGYLRPKEITPVLWRPLDSRRWEIVAQLTNSPDKLNIRGSPRERIQHSLITPNSISAAKRVQITYQDPKRNVSEKVSLLSTTRTKRRDQEHFDCETPEKGLRIAFAHCPQPSSGFVIAKEHGIGNESLDEIQMCSGIEVTNLAERQKPLKDSKIQDRINLFSNGGPHVNHFAMPIARMRNQSTSAKLPFEVIYETPTKAYSKVPNCNCNAQSQVEMRNTSAKSVTAIEVASSEGLEIVADKQLSQQQSQKPEVQPSAPRKSSGIGDKIQHFEAFASSQAASVGRGAMGNNMKWSSKSKRIQTWPIPASDYVFSRKMEQSKATEQSAEKKQAQNDVGNIFNPASNSTELKDDKMIKYYPDRERTKQEIQSSQECLNRRPCSRSRSARSVTGPAGKHDEISKGFEHMKHNFGVNARIKKRTNAAKGTDQQLKTVPNIHLETNIDRRQLGNTRVKDIWKDGTEGGPPQEVVVVDTVVAQCELAEPRPMRLAETLRMIRLCRGRFGERSGTWRRKSGRSSEKGGFAS